MFRKLTVSLVPIALFMFSGCEMLQKIPFEPVEKGSLIVVDEANQSFYAINTNSLAKRMVGVFPTTTVNDVEVEHDFAYFVISSPLANPTEGNKLLRFDLSNGSLIALSLPAGSNPYNLAVDADRIYVTLSVSNMLAVIDKTSFLVSSYRALPRAGEPYGVAFDAGSVYVATSAGWMTGYSDSHIVRFSKTDFSATTIPVGPNPMSIAVHDGTLYVACTGDYSGTGCVQSVTLSTLAVSNMTLPALTPTFVKYHDHCLFATDATWGGSGGVIVHVISNALNTRILAGSDLKGLDFAQGRVFLTEGYLGSKIYSVNLDDLSVTTNSGPGGGDCALYR